MYFIFFKKFLFINRHSVFLITLHKKQHVIVYSDSVTIQKCILFLPLPETITFWLTVIESIT